MAETTRLARLVRESVRFWARVATRSKALAQYHLRGSGIPFHIRHATVDIMTFDQIAGHGHYAPPVDVEDVLRGLPQPLRIADLGANIGLFGAYIRGLLPDAQIVGFEPLPENVEIHRRTIAANDSETTWRLVAACADVSEGEVQFSVNEFTTGRIEVEAVKTLTVPAVDVFPYLEEVDFLKIDIEGAEWRLLADPRFDSLPARVVALEYHTHECPDPDPSSYARQRLEAAGFRTQEVDFAATPGHGMIWAWTSP